MCVEPSDEEDFVHADGLLGPGAVAGQLEELLRHGVDGAELADAKQFEQGLKLFGSSEDDKFCIHTF